jgi:hypothetical protein
MAKKKTPTPTRTTPTRTAKKPAPATGETTQKEHRKGTSPGATAGTGIPSPTTMDAAPSTGSPTPIRREIRPEDALGWAEAAAAAAEDERDRAIRRAKAAERELEELRQALERTVDKLERERVAAELEDEADDLENKATTARKLREPAGASRTFYMTVKVATGETWTKATCPNQDITHVRRWLESTDKLGLVNAWSARAHGDESAAKLAEREGSPNAIKAFTKCGTCGTCTYVAREPRRDVARGGNAREHVRDLRDSDESAER